MEDKSKTITFNRNAKVEDLSVDQKKFIYDLVSDLSRGKGGVTQSFYFCCLSFQDNDDEDVDCDICNRSICSRCKYYANRTEGDTIVHCYDCHARRDRGLNMNKK